MWFRRKSSKSSIARADYTQVITRTRLPVDLLENGMRVISLDRPWTEVPVLFQGLVIGNVQELRILRHYCHWVLVEGETRQLATARDKLARMQRRSRKPMKETQSLAAELPRARSAYDRTQQFVNSVLNAIAKGSELNLDDARPVVQACIKSIQSNNNAMFWMTRIKSQDAYTAEHCLRVAVYTIAFGRFLNMPEDDLEVVGLCGLLHDIGKLRVSNNILNKPGPLTDEEMVEMRSHTEWGYRLLSSHHTLDPIVADVTRHHHERMDGKGYPSRLQEWQISRFARLVSIVDAFDAITSDRCYRKGTSASDAMRILYQSRGEQFDAELVEAFIRMMGIYPPGTLVELNSGEVALITGTHPGKKLKPRLEILLDEHKNPRIPAIIDLAADPKNSNGQVYSIRQPLPDGAYGVSLEDRIKAIVDTENPTE